MDAITLLKNDHKTVEKLFKQFEKAGPQAYVEKRKVVDRIIEELSVHAAIEESLFYPATRVLVPDTEDVALESLEEHHVAKVLLAELEKMDPKDERFVAKTTVLIESVRHHVEEEEEEYFPKVREALGRNALSELGEAMEEMKPNAPTRPRPHAPDEGLAGSAAIAAAGMVDRVGDTVSGIAQGGYAAFRDLIDRIIDVTPVRSSPKGSKRTRRTADDVRSGIDERLDRVIESMRRADGNVRDTVGDIASTVEETASAAVDGAAATAKAARQGAKRTATSARRGARSTGRSAKKAASRTAKTAKSS